MEDFNTGDLRQEKPLMVFSTTTILDKSIYDTVISLTSLFEFDKMRVREYIPEDGRVKSMTCFKLLLLVVKYPGSSSTALLKYSNNRTAFLATDRLLSFDLIRVIGKPRLIKPFQRFKVDKGYVITDKGKQVLVKILSSIKK